MSLNPPPNDVFFRSHLLQADSDEDCKMWITEITSGISRAFKDAENHELKQVRWSKSLT